VAKLIDRLKQLYQLATLRPEEENDEGRKNEARNAAFLLLKTARENGVKIKFEVKREDEPPAPPARGFYNPPQTAQTVADFEDILADIFRGVGSVPPPTVRARQREEDFLDRMQRAAREQRERQAQEQAARDAQRKERQATQSGFVWPETRPKPAHKKVKSASGQPPIIVAKFGGQCYACGDPYFPGDEVWWIRSSGCAHKACDPSLTDTPNPC
jgi:hypothetical protein